MGLTALTLNTVASTTTETAYWEDVAGGTRTVTQTVDISETIQSDFNCSGIGEYDTAQTGSLLTGIAFPDGTSLGFTYEGTPYNAGHYTGRINQITLREGGTVSYTYGGSNNGINCAYQTVPVLTRTLGNGDQTTYTLAYSLISGSSYKATNIVVDPGGNESDYTFTGFTSTGTSTAYAQVLTEVQRYQGNGTGKTLLTTDIYCYNKAFGSCSTSTAPNASVTYPISEVVVFHEIGSSGWSATDTDYDSHGNVTYVGKYGFGAASPRLTTTITYGSCTASCNTVSPTISNAAMAANYIYNHPGTVVTAEYGGYNVAQTNYTYDSHGNLTSTQYWTGSAFIGQTTSTVFNGNGTPSKTYDVNNNETDYTYSTSSYGDYNDSCPSGLNPPFPTLITDHSTSYYSSYTYDCMGGVPLIMGDYNRNNITYGYVAGSAADPYWRVGSVTDPYSYTVQYLYPTSSTLNYTANYTFGGSINETVTTDDNYGRPILAQSPQSPSSGWFDTVSTAYSWPTGANHNYREMQTSQPCSTGSGGSCPLVHTRLFDPLGRLHSESTTGNETITNTYSSEDVATVVTNGPATQTEYDGFGRPVFVCHVGTTASTGSGTACGNAVNMSYNGATDAYTYTYGTGYTTTTVQRNGTQTRSTTYDALRRVTQRTTPEGGTWNYYYDYTSSAPTACASLGAVNSAGNLICKVDPNGITTVYVYGTLNRLTGVGTSAAGGTCRRFYYDNTSGVLGTIPTGITESNNVGRLTEAETDNCTWPVGSQANQMTDEWFAYDKDGNVTDLWQWSKHSTQYYHSVATYFDNGAVKTVQLAAPNDYTMTYTMDGEGRWNTLTDTTVSQSIVTGATFYPAANPATISLTGTAPDTDSYTFDNYTGRITNYSFTVGATPKTLSGTLAWTAQGSTALASLTTSDGFNAGGTLTSTDTYDSWSRLTQFDNGSGNWGQNFTYDIYDNLSKSVMAGRTGTNWNPGYGSPSTNNHCTGCSYDYDGNQESDGTGSNYWGYNEYSKQAWYNTSSLAPTCGTNGKCFTYDAFGRAVEMSNGGSWVELWFTQAGTANMSGATLNYAYWSAPGGGKAIVSGNSTNFYYLHKDWIGNARLVSDLVARTVTVDQAYTPYGETFAVFGSGNSAYDEFAGMTANFNNGIQYETPNREFAIFGRWLSPDPAGSGWNQYAYVTNPNGQTDPLGLYCDLQQAASGCGQEGGFNEWGSDAGDPDNGPSVYSSWSGFQVNSGWVGSWGSVGADSSPSGQYTGTYEPPGWNGGQQVQDYTPGTGPDPSSSLLSDIFYSFQPVMPVWGPNNLAKAGCTGPEIPCTVSRASYPSPGRAPWATSFEYTILDVDNNLVYSVTSVTEYWTMITGPIPNQGLGDTWYDNVPNDYANVVVGSYVDTYGSQPGYYGMQSYAATVGGVPYVISTSNYVYAPAGGGTVSVFGFNP